MAEVPNPKWYDEGTVALTQGSPAVTGTGTFWVSAGVKVGDIFVDANGMIYEITAVNDSTSLTLGKNYTGATGSGKGYSIIRVFNSTMNATLAKRISTLLSEFEQRYDLDMQTITPKNAYDIAKDNGFTGTESDWLTSLNAYGIAKSNGYTGTAAEWLESLKAAGEWTKLDDRTKVMATTGSCDWRNSIAGFRNKGTVLTDEHLAAIANKTFDDMGIGDYWVLNGHKYWIAKFSDSIWSAGSTKTMIMLSDTLYNAPMNETDTNEGGYYNSWMFSEGLRQAGEILAADWGSRVRNINDYFTRSNASGPVASAPSVAAPFKCMLPSYFMIHGNPYPHYPQTWYSIYGHSQFPIFAYEGMQGVLMGTNNGFWLQECYNNSDSFLAWSTNALESTPAKMKASVSRGVRVIFFVN